MWRILKAEYTYNNYTVITAFSLVMIISIIFLMWGGDQLAKSVPAYRSVLVAAVMIVWMYRMMQLQKEKRDRIHILLPIPIGKISAPRVLFIILFWASILFLFIICNLIIQNPADFSPLLWRMCSLSGFVLLVNAVPFIQRDFIYTFLQKYQKVINNVIWIIVLILGFLLYNLFMMSTDKFGSFSGSAIYFHKAASSVGFALLLLLIGVGFSFLSIIIFKRRKIYTD